MLDDKLKRLAQLLKQFSLLEFISTATALLAMVVESSRVFHAVDIAALQVTHRRRPAPYGMLAVGTSCTSNSHCPSH